MIAIIGSNGDLGGRVLAQIDSHDKVLQIDIHNSGELDAYLPEIDIALIVTPPHTHQFYIEKLVLSGVPRVLCEKPLPVLPCVLSTESIRIIDHYLFKQEANNSKLYFKERQNDIKSISLFLCEAQIEQRHWMWSRSSYGGVVFDLMHHMAALLGYMAEDYQSITRITNIDIKNVTFFSAEDPAEKHIELECIWQGKIIKMTVSKSSYDKKGVEFLSFNGQTHHIDLSDKVNYRKIIEVGRLVKTSPLLDFQDAEAINGFLIKVVNLIDVGE